MNCTTELLDLEDKIEYQNFLLRKVLPEVSSREFKLVSFIYDRTIGWNKLAEHISANQFVNGVYHRKTGVTYSKGSGMSRSRVYDCLALLIKKKLVIRLPKNKYGVSAYSINFDWEGAEEPEKEEEMLRISKKRKKQMEEEGSLHESRKQDCENPENRTDESHYQDTKKVKEKKITNKEMADLTVYRSTTKHRTIVEQKKKNPTVKGLKLTWKDSFRKVFEDDAAKYEKFSHDGVNRNLKTWIQEWREKDGTHFDFEKFFDNVCQNWETLCNTKFNLWKECPRYPNLNLVYYLREKLRVAFYSVDYYRKLEEKHDKLAKLRKSIKGELDQELRQMDVKKSKVLLNVGRLEDLLEEARGQGLESKIKNIMSDEEWQELLDEDDDFGDFDSGLRLKEVVSE